MQTPSELIWEKLNSSRGDKKWYNENWEVYRAKVPNGWLILVRGDGESGNITFMPDQNHVWNGGSLP